MSPIVSPELTQASSTPDHSRPHSFLQSPFGIPKLKPATAVPGPSLYCPQTAFGRVCATPSRCFWGPSGGSCHEAGGGRQPGAVPRTSKRLAVSVQQQSRPGLHSRFAISPLPVAIHHHHISPDRWHRSRTPGKVSPAWRPQN